MATGGDTSIVTTQPKSRRREIEEFVRDLDPLQVAGEYSMHVIYFTLIN